ncbi:class I SAM-dependent methyltransferase [Teredinibacter purpureus]|uniref:class I SAM-dependent methyltransferase n=1 Tax=Teredinibacter purpureus TaxID=2731756 RepID=UPI0005F81B2F|nr:class I SAM-dependent methyltransferase [Teredinibacter purpureus]
MNPDNSSWQGDKHYHSRHYQRSLKRAERIGAHIHQSNHFLDVGCNQGITTSYLLNQNKITKATGIELAQGATSEALLSNSQFDLIIGDICSQELHQQYDTIFYGAVHHHIVRENGLGSAIDAFQNLARHCDGQMFFETGELSEGSRWEWQRRINQYFQTDEEHLHYLFNSIEPILSDIEIIGKFYIHGTWRWLIKLSIQGSNWEPKNSSTPLPLTAQHIKSFGRSFGSKNQNIADDQHLISDSGVELKLYATDAKEFFVKKRFRTPHLDIREYEIGSQLKYDWAVIPTGLCEEGIVFPYIRATTMSVWQPKHKKDYKNLAQQLRNIWGDAKKTTINLRLTAFNDRSQANLLDIIDINLSNMLVNHDEENPLLKIVDFEFHSTNCLWKNRLNFGNAFFQVKAYKIGAAFYCAGIYETSKMLFKAQFHSAEWRIKHRQPSFALAVSSKTRAIIEKVILKFIPYLNEK